MGQVRSSKSVAELFGVPPPPATGRERLVTAGIELFYRHGFQAVSLDQVIAHAGVTKTTFYKHFESKEDLVLAAVQQRDQWESLAWNRAVQQLAGDDPAGQLLGFFDVADMWFNDPDFRGCIFINTAAEFPDPRDPIHEAAAEHKRRARDHFRDLAQRAGVLDADTFADAFTALFEGMLVLRHTHGRNDAARVVKPTAAQLLRAYLVPEAHEGTSVS